MFLGLSMKCIAFSTYCSGAVVTGYRYITTLVQQGCMSRLLWRRSRVSDFHLGDPGSIPGPKNFSPVTFGTQCKIILKPSAVIPQV